MKYRLTNTSYFICVGCQRPTKIKTKLTVLKANTDQSIVCALNSLNVTSGSKNSAMTGVCRGNFGFQHVLIGIQCNFTEHFESNFVKNVAHSGLNRANTVCYML